MYQTDELKKLKILKEGEAKFYVLNFSDRDYKGNLFIGKNGKPYFKGIFKVTDSLGDSEKVYKIFSLDYKKDLIKLLRSIGKDRLIPFLSPNFEWDILEDESGLCRIETIPNQKYGEITSITSFIKKDSDYSYLRQPPYANEVNYNPPELQEEEKPSEVGLSDFNNFF